MALTIAEASSVNIVVRHLMGEQLPDVEPETVVKAAALLADHANKTLGAGIHGSTVHVSSWARTMGVW